MFDTDIYSVNVGPVHPSTHGGLHAEAIMNGEIIEDVIVHLGYVHRSVEKIAEGKTYQQYVPYTARLDYLATNLPVMGYCQTVEKLLGIEIPERAEYIRVIMAELSRIASHQIAVAATGIDLGATTGLMYAMRDRERIMDIFAMTGGQRLLSSYIRIGGVAADIPEGFIPAVNDIVNDIPKMMDEYNDLLTGNEIWGARMKGVGVLKAEDAIAYGVTGPNLRASGISYDLRKAEPYSIYDRFDFVVPTRNSGDSLARWQVRIEEIGESGRIIKQALDGMPEGEIKGKVPKNLKPEAGAEVYHHIESSKGELGYYIVSDGGAKPYRLHVRAPSFINLMVLPLISRGGVFQDIITNIATLDPILGESDR
ncbi:MAG TPA: NADH-quinone oxidoreductase subunit D [Syntrophomonadaceae bacterium]|nr:NADH-quinone oxidoreductase subunit D [Syntrophomonadaceae bacterium]HPR93532.1 NADH-quinone oxidoreductase subunit D [Syntrophomonadaceae bacterium]